VVSDLVLLLAFAPTPDARPDWSLLRRSSQGIQALSLKLSGESRSESIRVPTDQSLLVNRDGRFVSTLVMSAPGGPQRSIEYFDSVSQTSVVFASNTFLERQRAQAKRLNRPPSAEGWFDVVDTQRPLGTDWWLLVPWPVLDLAATWAEADPDATMVRADGLTVLRSPSIGLTFSLDANGRLVKLAAENSTLIKRGTSEAIEFLGYSPVGTTGVSLPNRIVQRFMFETESVMAWTVTGAEVNPPDAEARLIFDAQRLNVIPRAEFFSPGPPQLTTGDKGSTPDRDGQGTADRSAAAGPVGPGGPGSPPMPTRDRLRDPAIWGWVLAGASALALGVALVLRRGKGSGG
jgi:hypothetical protein